MPGGAKGALSGGDLKFRIHLTDGAICSDQGCQMAKFDPFLAPGWRVGAQSKERKGSNFAV